MSKTKLELTWTGKDKRPKLEAPELSYHASQKVTENDIFDNKLIFGDNLLALKALEQEYTGKVKCVYIAPPKPCRLLAFIAKAYILKLVNLGKAKK